MGKMCKGCGMPMKQDPEGGGNETDGSKSAVYCSFCYDVGAFRIDGITMKEMQVNCIKALQKKGFPRFSGWLLTRNIPKLDRWQKA